MSRAPWTVLVWLGGDNRRDELAHTVLDELKQVGSSDSMTIAAQVDLFGAGEARRYRLRRHTMLAADRIDVVSASPGDPSSLVEFLSWGINTFPSERVMCVLWNHGAGADESDLLMRARQSARIVDGGRSMAKQQRAVRAVAASRFRHALFAPTVHGALESAAIAARPANGEFLDIAELGRAMATVVERTGRAVDVVGFDGSLVNLIEDAYQLRGLVGHVVGPVADGTRPMWAYDHVMRLVERNPSARELARSVVDGLGAGRVADIDQRIGDGDDVDVVALDLGHIEPVVGELERLVATCLSLLDNDRGWAAFARSIAAACHPHQLDVVDLVELCAQLHARCPRSEVAAAARRLHRSLTGPTATLVTASTAESDHGDLGRAMLGASAYFPVGGSPASCYDDLDFAKDTRWSALIAKYLT